MCDSKRLLWKHLVIKPDTGLLWQAIFRNTLWNISEEQTAELWTTNKKLTPLYFTTSTFMSQMRYMSFFLVDKPKIPTQGTTRFPTIYKSTSIFFPFPFSFTSLQALPLFVPLHRNLHKKYFHLRYKQTTIGTIALGFLFTGLFKMLEHSSFHYALYTE